MERKNSSESDLPDWLIEHQSPALNKTRVEPSSSDDEGVWEVTQPERKEEEGAGGEEARDAGVLEQPTTSKVGAAVSASRSEYPLVIPEKLLKTKVLVELEYCEDKSATDLSGDAGAVGRVLITGKPGSEKMQLDLKGVIYDASVLPLVGTAMVINISATDAKVESLVHDFVRLTEVENQNGDEGDMDRALLGSDSEDYRAEPESKDARAAEGKGVVDGKGPSGSGAGRGAGSKGKGQAKPKNLGAKQGGVVKKVRAPGAAARPKSHSGRGASKSSGLKKKGGKGK